MLFAGRVFSCSIDSAECAFSTHGKVGGGVTIIRPTEHKADRQKADFIRPTDIRPTKTYGRPTKADQKRCKDIVNLRALLLHFDLLHCRIETRMVNDNYTFHSVMQSLNVVRRHRHILLNTIENVPNRRFKHWWLPDSSSIV